MTTPNSPTQFDTSFLPQQPLSRVDGGAHRKEPISLSMIIALIMFFMMLVAMGGVVLYKKTIERRIEAEKGELASREQEIDMETIAGFDSLSSRLVMATKILNEHSAFSLALKIISDGTAVNVGYSKLSFMGSDGLSTISLDGVAPSYAAVYFQGEALRARPYIKNVIIANPVLDVRSGTVSFHMEVTLQPNVLRYGRYFENSDKTASSTGNLIMNPNAAGTSTQSGTGNGKGPAI
jgi:hypothetical protein